MEERRSVEMYKPAPYDWFSLINPLVSRFLVAPPITCLLQSCVDMIAMDPIGRKQATTPSAHPSDLGSSETRLHQNHGQHGGKSGCQNKEKVAASVLS